MVLDSYLVKISEQLIISDIENENIKNALDLLQQKINKFLNGVSEHFCFGSYMRGTCLPHSIDTSSDVDYLIVFKQGSSENSDCILQSLSEFVIQQFPEESVIQSAPTCIVELNGIYFELIPAYKNEKYFINYKIPAKDNSQTEWIATIPNDLNEYLLKVNSDHYDYVIPVIRIIKYWNVLNNYIYSSYYLENQLTFIDYPDSSCLLDYFFCACQSLPTDDLDELKKKLVMKFKAVIETIKNESSQDKALVLLSRIIPFI